MKFILLILLSFSYVFASIDINKEKELCKIIIDSNIKELINKCSKYLERHETFEIINKKFTNLDNNPEKKIFFKKYVAEYRKIVSYAENTNKYIDKYILNNYQSNNTSHLKNIDIIFSNNNYVASKNLMRELISNDISNINFSKNSLNKLKLFKNIIFTEAEKKYKDTIKKQKTIKTYRKKRNLPLRKSIQTTVNPLFNDIDLVTMSALYNKENKTLGITLFYQNKAKDKQVFWEKGEIFATCRVYGNSGSFLYPKKGSQIGKKSNKKLTRAFQKLYIDMLPNRYDNGIAECVLTINHRKFKANNTFLIH